MTEAEHIMVSRFARRLARSAPRWLIDADDLYQVGALALLEHKRPWQAMIDELRRFGRWRKYASPRLLQALAMEQQTAEQWQEIVAPEAAPERRYALREWIGHLSARDQQMVTLCLLGVPQRESARRLGLTEGRISQRMTQLRRAAHAC